jgi:hypothetical protein
MPTVVLTATVRPHVASRLTLTDPVARAKDYRRALARWAALARTWPELRIVLAENSGADLDRLVAGLPGVERVELISLTPPGASTVARGKGACEAALLTEVLPRLGTSDVNDLVLKCTGRLFVANVRRMLPSNHDSRAVVARATVDLSFADARLFGATSAGWQRWLAGMSAEVDEPRGRWLENVLAGRLALALAGGGTVHRLRGAPRFEGRSGTDGRDYGRRPRLRSVLTGPLEAALRGPLSSKQF